MTHKITGLLVSCLFTQLVFAQKTFTQATIAYKWHNDMVEAVVFSPNGKFVFSGSWDKTINMYPTDTNLLMRKIQAHNSAITTLAFSAPSGKPMTLISGSKDFLVKTYDSLGNNKKEYAGYNTAVTCIAVDPAGKYMYTGSTQQGINQWELENPAAAKKNYPFTGVNAIACARNGNVYIGINSPDVQVMKQPAGTISETLVGSGGEIISLACSNSGKYLVSGSAKGTVIVWELSTGKQFKVIPAHTWKVTSVVISKDEKYIVSGSNDGTAKLWELATGKLLATFENAGYNVRSVAITSDNSKVAVAAYQRGVSDYGISLYNVADLIPAPAPKPAPLPVKR